MSSWLKYNGGSIGAVGGTLAAFVAVLQLFVVSPMNQRFNDLRAYIDQRLDRVDRRIDDLTTHMNKRFDSQDKRFDSQDVRLDRLADEVAALRRLTVSIGERLSRSEGQIEVIREQIKIVDAP